MEPANGIRAALVEGAPRHKRLLALLFLSIMATAILLTLLLPKQYESRMTLVVQSATGSTYVPMTGAGSSGNAPGGAAGANGKQAAAALHLSQDTMDTQVNSEVDLLGSEDLLHHMVAYRGVLDPDEPAPEEGSKDMAAAEAALSKRLSISPVARSMVIDVSYTDKDPRIAQKMLAEFSRAYLEKRQKLKSPTAATSALDTEAVDYDKKLTEAQDELAQLQKSNDYISLSEKKESLSRSIEDANAAILRDQASLASVEDRIASLQGELASVPARTVAQQAAPISGTQTALAANLTDLRVKRAQALARYPLTDPVVKELDDQIARAEGALKQGNATSAGSAKSAAEPNPVWQSLRKQLGAQQLVRSSIVAHLSALDGQIAEYRRLLGHLEDVTPQDDQLQRRVSELRDAAQTFATRRDAARIEEQLQQEKLGEVSVAIQPTFSWRPVRPNMLLNCTIGLAAAVLLSMLFLLLLESRRETVLTSSELEAITGKPVLASIDDIHDIERIFGMPNTSAAAGELPYPWRESSRK